MYGKAKGEGACERVGVCMDESWFVARQESSPVSEAGTSEVEGDVRAFFEGRTVTSKADKAFSSIAGSRHKDSVEECMSSTDDVALEIMLEPEIIGKTDFLFLSEKPLDATVEKRGGKKGWTEKGKFGAIPSSSSSTRTWLAS